MTRVRDLARTYWLEVPIVLLTVDGIVELLVRRDAPDAPRTTLWFTVPALAVLVIPLFARRRFPFGAPLVFWLMATALTFVDGRLLAFTTSTFVLGMAAAFLLGNVQNGARARIGLVIVLGAEVILVHNIPEHPASQLVFIPILFGICWVAGFALRERAEQAEAALVRASEAERDRDVATRIAVSEERARIARELHDIVAHAVSVMVLQVGAVRHKLRDTRAEDREVLIGVEQTGRAALAEMRRLLAVMRRDSDDVELTPQPGLDGLDSLVKRIERTGLPVRVRIDGEPFPLPRGIDLSAYRIVQEGLTNTVKHAAASHAEVTVQYLWRRDERGHGERPRLRPQHAPPGRARTVVRIRVLIADDQSMVRAGFRMLLSGEEDIDVVAEARDGLEAVAKAQRFDPTVVLMDIRMPELDGLEAARRIIAANHSARILILTTFGLDEYVYEALRAGASGFVLKDDPPERLIAAVRTVAAGEALLSPAVTKRVIKQFTRIHRPVPPKELDALTARERDILRLIAGGLSNAEIGGRLYISETTVKTHVTHILQKLGLRDRVQAVVLAYQIGLAEADARV